MKGKHLRVGQVYGELTVTELLPFNENKTYAAAILTCSCGKVVKKSRDFRTKQKEIDWHCGCMLARKHIGAHINGKEVLSYLGRNRGGDSIIELKCSECEMISVRTLADINQNRIGKCSHKERESHRMSSTSTYSSWKSMIQRCKNPNNPHKKFYQDKGIDCCVEWETFSLFLKDMGERPQGMSLERVDNNKGYYKDNCKWATQEEQVRNRGKSRTKGNLKGSYAVNEETFIASITDKEGDSVYLGTFYSEEAAGRAYDKAAKALGYLTNEDLGLY